MLRGWVLAELSGGVSVDPTCTFFVDCVDKTYFCCFLLDPGVHHTATVGKLLVDSVLDEEELSHDEALESSAHQIEGKSENQVQKEEDLHPAFAFIYPPLVVSNEVSISVEGKVGKLQPQELDDAIEEEEYDGGIVQIVYKSDGSE